MRTRSALWLVSAALLMVGAALQTAALAIFWRPCAGSMLSGSVLQGYRFGRSFSDGCLEAMDVPMIFPLPSPGRGLDEVIAFGAPAAIVLALAWLVLVPALPVEGVGRIVAALPGVVAIAFVVADATGLLPAGSAATIILGLALEASVLAGVIALCMAPTGLPDETGAGIVVLLAATTQIGMVHAIVVMALAAMVSQANWDVPPGAGYLGVGFSLLAAVVAVWFWWRLRREERAA
ncbi:hypothetical protein [Propioniciclava soli]|uniref:hypothetical protein n=1 Tax=Propioniciclava soli TaxID=2775081 RepID=UPI001E2E1133|nr:hypothetical protein [Propioniciclava soli]